MGLELIFSVIASVLALLFVAYLARDVVKQDHGNERMQEISHLVQLGARAFLKREYTVLVL